jgi:hypothetical protein
LGNPRLLGVRNIDSEFATPPPWRLNERWLHIRIIVESEIMAAMSGDYWPTLTEP